MWHNISAVQPAKQEKQIHRVHLKELTLVKELILFVKTLIPSTPIAVISFI